MKKKMIKSISLPQIGHEEPISMTFLSKFNVVGSVFNPSLHRSNGKLIGTIQRPNAASSTTLRQHTSASLQGIKITFIEMCMIQMISCSMILELNVSQFKLRGRYF